MSNHSSEEEMDPYEEQDTPLLVEFSKTEEGTLQPVGLRDWFDRNKLKDKSDRAIEKAMTFIQEMSKKVNSTVKDMEGKPNHVEVQFGIRFDAEAGIIIAKASMESSLNVNLTWDRQ